MKVSFEALKILGVFNRISNPLWGVPIAEHANIATGTAYPLLARLEAEGYVKARQEKGDPVKLERPLRRFYVRTKSGEKLLNDSLAQILGEPE